MFFYLCCCVMFFSNSFPMKSIIIRRLCCSYSHKQTCHCWTILLMTSYTNKLRILVTITVSCWVTEEVTPRFSKDQTFLQLFGGCSAAFFQWQRLHQQKQEKYLLCNGVVYIVFAFTGFKKLQLSGYVRHLECKECTVCLHKYPKNNIANTL